MPFDLNPSQDILERYKTEYDRAFEQERRDFSKYVSTNYPKQEMVIDPSVYDTGYLYNPVDPYGDLENQRGEKQPGIYQIGAGLGKGVILFGTTAADGIIGTAVGLANMVGKQKGSAFWDNPFSRLMTEINDASEEWMPNYYTREEQKSSFFGQMLTSNFWGDKVIKNLGFTAGAIIDGIITGGAATEILGIKALASKLPKALLNASLKGEKTLAKVLAKGEFGELSAEVIKNAKQIARANTVVQGLGVAMSTQAEARFEAINNSKSFYESNLAKLDMQYSTGDMSDEEYESKLEQLKDATEGYGNADFLANTVILGISNAIQFKNLFTRGLTPNESIAKHVIGSIKSGYLKEGTKALDTFKVAKNVLTEGIYEEMGQYAAQKGVEDFYQKKYDGKIEGDIDDFFHSVYKGVSESYGTREGWDQGLVGSLTGFLGIPGLGGGVWGDIKEIKARNAYTNKAVTDLNKVINSPEFKSNYRNLVRTLSLEQDKLEGANNNEKYQVLNKEHDQFINDALTFIRAGKYEDFVDNIDSIKNKDATDVREAFKQQGTSQEDKNRAFYGSKPVVTEEQQPWVDTFQKYTSSEIEDKLKKNASTMKKDAENIRDLFNAYSTKYPNANENTIDSLVYVASKLDNINNRINQINNTGIDIGIDVRTYDDMEEYNKDFKRLHKEALLNSTLDREALTKLKTDVEDLPQLLEDKAAYQGLYLAFDKEVNVRKLDENIKKDIEEKEEEIKKEVKQYLPTIDDLVQDEEDVYKVINENDEDDTIELQPLNDKGEVDSSKPTKTVPRSSVDLYAKKESELAQDNVETISDEEKVPDEDEQREKLFKRGIASAATAITHSGADPDASGTVKTEVRNADFNSYISNPKNDTKEDIITFEIDTDATFRKEKDDFWKKFPKLKEELSSGKPLSKERALQIINDIKLTTNEDYFNSPVDKLPIKIKYITKDGRIFDTGLFYHDSDYSNQKRLFIPPKHRDNPAAYIKADREKTRKARKEILFALLTGKEVKLTNISKTIGIPHKGKTKQKIHDVLKKSHNDIQLGIADSTGTIWISANKNLGDNMKGSPGNVFFATNMTCNGTTTHIKTNISKISKEHAGILFDAIIQRSRKGKGSAVEFEHPQVKGLTIGQTIDLITLVGAATNVNHKNNVGRDMKHLANKQLFVDKGVLHFGNTFVKLSDIYNGKFDMKRLRNDFIEWTHANKNYTVAKQHRLNNNGLGFELNKPMTKNFTIGSWEGSTEDTYAGSLIKNGMVLTDLEEFEDTNSLFEAPVTIIDIEGLEALPKLTKEEKKKQKEVADKVEKDIKKTAEKDRIPTGNKVVILDKGVKYEDDILTRLPSGSSVFVSNITTVEVSAGVYEEEISASKHYFDVVDGKIINIAMSIKDPLAIEVDELELTDTNVKRLNRILSRQSYVYADTTNTIKGLDEQVKDKEPTPEEIEEQEVKPSPTINVTQDKPVTEKKTKKTTITPPAGYKRKSDTGTKPRLGDPSNLNKAVPDDIKEYKVWDKDKELKWLKDKLGNAPYKVLQGFIYDARTDKKLFGQLRKDCMVLSGIAVEGTTYHEAFHRVSRLYLDATTREAMYDEARRKYKKPSATNLEIEELLADEFMKYVIEQEKNITSKSFFGRVGEFFKNLYLLVKQIFTGNNKLTEIDIDHLFESIQQGKFRYNKPLADNIRRWSNDLNLEYRGRQLDTVDSHKDFMSVVKGLTAELLRGSSTTLFGEPKFKYSTVDVKEAIKQISFDKLRGDILSDLVDANVENAENRNYEFVVLDRHLNKGPKINPELASQLKADYGTDNLSTIRDKAHQEAENALKWANMYKEVLQHFDDIYKPAIIDYIYSELGVDKYTDEDRSAKELLEYDQDTFQHSAKDNIATSIKFLISHLKASNERSPVTGIVELASKSEVWSRLLSTLSNLDTYEEMIEAIDSVNNYQPFAELSKLLKQGNDILRTQFETSMRMHKHNFIDTLVEIEEDGNFKFTFVDADIHSASRQVVRQWSENMLYSDLFDGSTEININEIKKLQAEYTKIKEEFAYDFKKLNNTLFNEYVSRLISIYSRMGINIDSTTISNLILDKVASAQTGTKEGALDIIITKDLYRIFDPVHGTLSKYVSGKEIDPRYVIKNESSIHTLLANAYVRANPSETSDVVPGEEGNLKWMYSLPTYISDVIRKINKDPNTIKDMKSDVFAHYSHILNILDTNPELREGLKLGTFNSFTVKNIGDTGRGYLQISPLEDFLYKLNATRDGYRTEGAGYLILPTLADRKTYFTIKGLKFKEFNYHKLNNGDLVIPDDVLEIFVNYARGERHRIERAKEDIETAKKTKNYSRLVENYHYKKEGKEYNTSQANATRHILFPSLNEKVDKKGDFKIPTNDVAFKEEVRKILEDRIKDALAEATKLGVITKTNKNNLLDRDDVKTLTEKLGSEEDAVKSIIADFELKTQMSSIETMMLFMGDPAFYKSVDGSPFEDYTKRLSVITSSGTITRKKIPAEFENDTYNTVTLSSYNLTSPYYDLIYNKQKEILEKKYPDDPEYIKTLLSNLLKAYEDVDPTDAQVLLSPEMFREISIRRGSWSQETEDDYNLLQSDRKLTPEEKQKALNVVMQPLKYVYFDLIREEGLTETLLIPTYDKMSMATLFRQFTKGTYYDELLDRMEAKGKYAGMPKIHMVKYDTAVKVGNRIRHDLLKNTDESIKRLDPSKPVELNDLNELVVYEQNFSYLRHQTVTDPHEKQENTLAIQVRKMAQANILVDSDYDVSGTTVKGKEVRRAINQSLALLSDRGIQQLVNKLGVDNKGNMNMDLFYDTLLSEAKKAGMPMTVIEALEKKISIDLLPDRKWIYQRFVSLLNKYGVDIKFPGNQLIQMSGFGLGKVTGEHKDYTNNLRFLFDENGKITGLQGSVSVQLFKNVIPNYSKKSHEEKVEWLKNNTGVLEGLAYRIPTQGQNSILPITVVDFLPENVGDVIILPNELTALTGSDFDIDKLYFIRYNYFTDKNGNAHKVEVSKGETDEEVRQRYDSLAMEIFEGAPILDKESDIILRKLYQEKFRFIAKKKDLTDEEGSTYKVLQEQYDDILFSYDKAVEDKDEGLAETCLIEAGKVMSKIVDLDFYQNSLNEIDEDIWKQVDTIEEILVKNEVLPTIEIFKTWAIERQQTRKALQNHLLDNYRAVILSEHNFTYSSVPLGAIKNIIKRVAKAITPKTDKTISLSQTGVVAQARVKYEFGTSKFGVGVFALSNVHHVLTQIAGTSFRTNLGIGLTDIDGNTSLSSIDSLPEDDGQIIAILDWLSTMLDAHVDIAKDPYIIRLNVVNKTYNVTSLLLRIGMGSKTFKFLPQPILKDLVQESLNDRGNIKNQKDDKPEEIIRRQYEDDFKLFTQEEQDNANKELVEYNPFNDDLLKLITTDKKDALWYAKQLKILELFIKLDKGSSRQLSALVMGSRVDTKKAFKDLITNELYIDSLDDIYEEDAFTNLDKLLGYNPITETATQDIDGTFIATLLNNTSFKMRSLFGDKSFTGSTAFLDMVMYISKQAGINMYTPDKVEKIVKIADEVYSSLVQKFFREELVMSDTEINTIREYVPKFLRNASKYPELENNKLVQSLVKGLWTQDGMTFTGIPMSKIDEASDESELMYEWIRLLSSTNKDVVGFAKKLFIYSFYTTGNRPGVYSINQYVPVKLFESLQLNDLDVSFNEWVGSLSEEMKNEELGPIRMIGLVDDIFENNWNNSYLVPKVRDGYVDTGILDQDSPKGDTIKNPYVYKKVTYGKDKDVIVATFRPWVKDRRTNKNTNIIPIIGTNGNGDPIYQPYILYNVNKEESILMKFIGYQDNKSKHPVYMAIPKKGYSSKGRKWYELGFEKSLLKYNEQTTLSEDKVMELLNENKNYKDFNYIDEGMRNTVERVELDSPQEDTTEKTYTVTEDRSLNVGAENSIKQGVSELFENNPELASIGTQQAYSQYLDSIFPDSPNKKLLYHIGGKNIEKFDSTLFGKGEGSNVSGLGVYFQESPYEIMNLGIGSDYFYESPTPIKSMLEDGVLTIAVADIKPEDSFNPNIKFSQEIVIRDVDRIHILGGKQDIQGFKEFVDKSNSVKEGAENGPNASSTQGLESGSIYQQLGDKTKSENIVIKPWGELKNNKEVVTAQGIIATRIPNTNEHFGNLFSDDPAGKAYGLIKTETVKEAVEKYIDWVINSQDVRANWIREQLKSGTLKNKPILYYKELGEPSHATALDYLINKYNWNISITQEQLDAINKKFDDMAPFTTSTTMLTMRDFYMLSKDEQDNLLNCL